MSSCSRNRTKAPRSARGRRNNGFSSSSANMVADIDDILIQILSLLPIKTLIRFKRVSKRWRSLITNPDISNRIISSKHPLPITGFFLQETRDIKYRFVSLDDQVNERLSLSSPFRFADHSTPMIVMQSTNGLLLCKCSCPPNQFDRNYYVYNPTTKQNTLLPRIIGQASLALAFDPSKSPHYKVFCLSSDSDLYHIDVYSSNEGPWRRILSLPSLNLHPAVIELGYTVFWNDSVHWFGPNSRDCLYFDINQEEIKILQLPNLDHQEDQEEEGLPDPGALRFMDESRGNLYFIEVNDLSSSDLPVYEMERNGLSWSLKHNVDLELVAAGFPEIIADYYNRRIYVFSVIGLVNKETDSESYILLRVSNKAVKYNFIDKTIKKLCSFEPSHDDGYDFHRFRRSFQFIESLANV